MPSLGLPVSSASRTAGFSERDPHRMTCTCAISMRGLSDCPKLRRPAGRSVSMQPAEAGRHDALRCGPPNRSEEDRRLNSSQAASKDYNQAVSDALGGAHSPRGEQFAAASEARQLSRTRLPHGHRRRPGGAPFRGSCDTAGVHHTVRLAHRPLSRDLREGYTSTQPCKRRTLTQDPRRPPSRKNGTNDPVVINPLVVRCQTHHVI
jgi:hypothetical protein